MATLIPCLAGLLRGRLRHSHLQNTYFQDPDLVRALVTEEYGEHLFWEETLMRLDQLKAELADPTRGFSPAYLVTDGFCGTGPPDVSVEPLRPLQSLTVPQRELLKERLLKIYSEQFGLEQRLQLLDEADTNFRSTLNEFVLATDPEEAIDLKLEKASRKLFEVLGSLPEGIWLPEITE